MANKDWNNSNEILLPICQNRCSVITYDCKWLQPNSSKIVTVGKKQNNKGDISVYDLELLDDDSSNSKIPMSRLKLINQAENASPVRSSTVLNQNTIACGDFSGSISIWDINRFDIPITSHKNAHQINLNCMDFNRENSVLVCGAKDGSISFWDTRTTLLSKPIHFVSPVEGVKDNCWSVVTRGYFGLAGFENGQLHQMDLRNYNIIQKKTVEYGICSMDIDESNETLLVTTNGSIVKLMSVNELTDELVLNKGLNNTIWSGRFLSSSKPSKQFSIAEGNGKLSLIDYNPQSKTSKVIDSIQLVDSAIISMDVNKSVQGLISTISLTKQLCITITPYK
ncbi:WD40 repeat-containing protein [Tieghemostelium lacteum]|uniref:WD40 repeat-containing protein n=1 Tax=Tieghemostelium lacteum TaxID=361077 RepID=A0A151ZFN2_TIELA|nr:WD40 repeat-containing protein [Tieghemostelium lacteum]|eukprot:KYQ92737.1 WD40 repeat-containing protein [Tieghemostelium lacteum]